MEVAEMKNIRIGMNALLLGGFLLFASSAQASVDACCYPNGKCLEQRTDVCLPAGGIKPGAVDCDPNPCPQPEGGACMDSTSCFAGLECVDGFCRGKKMAPAASSTGLLLLIGGLALAGGFATRRKAWLS